MILRKSSYPMLVPVTAVPCSVHVQVPFTSSRMSSEELGAFQAGLDDIPAVRRDEVVGLGIAVLRRPGEHPEELHRIGVEEPDVALGEAEALRDEARRLDLLVEQVGGLARGDGTGLDRLALL